MHILFADDQVVMTDNDHDFKYTMRKLVNAYEAGGIKIEGKSSKHKKTTRTHNSETLCVYMPGKYKRKEIERKQVTKRIGENRHGTQNNG